MTIQAPALRRQANRALRLARSLSDERAAQALRIHATSLLNGATNDAIRFNRWLTW